MREKLRITPRRRGRAGPRGRPPGARQYTDDVEFSAEDASRTDPDFLCRVVRGRDRGGRHARSTCPTPSATRCPTEYAAMFRDVRARVPGADRMILSAHCHDDLGLAVANSLAAIAAGARQVECTVNGIGERAGNAALEEIVMASQVRGAALGFRCNVESREIYRTSQLLSYLTGVFPAAQQGDRRAQRLRPRGRHPSARHAAERPDLRDHPARDGGHSPLDPGARASTPAATRWSAASASWATTSTEAQLGERLPAVHRAGRPQARDPRRGSARAAARELPRRARGVPAQPPPRGLRQREPPPPRCG